MMPGTGPTANPPSGNIPDESWVNQVWAVIFAFGPIIVCFIMFFIVQAAWAIWQRHRAWLALEILDAVLDAQY